MEPQVWASEPGASKGRPRAPATRGGGASSSWIGLVLANQPLSSMHLKHTKPLLDPCGVLSVAVGAHTGWGLKTKSGTTKWKGGDKPKYKILL